MGGVIIGDKVRLRQKRLSDARNDYDWQTDPELARLDAAPVLAMSFPKYLLEYAVQLRYVSARRRAFAVETPDCRHIGNCAYYDIDEAKGEAEMGVMIGDRASWDTGLGTDAVMTLVNYIFLHTGLRRIHLKTLDWNTRALRSFEKCGFTPCGHTSRDGYSFVQMELHRESWEKNNGTHQDE